MYPRICPPLYQPDNYSPDLIPHHFCPGLSQLALTHLCSGSQSLLLPISLFPAHQLVWYYSVKPHWALSIFAQRASVTPLATQTESQSLRSLTESVSWAPSHARWYCLLCIFYCCLHMLVVLLLGFSYLSPSWRSLCWLLCELECPPPHKLCLSPPLLYSELTIWPGSRDCLFSHCPIYAWCLTHCLVLGCSLNECMSEYSLQVACCLPSKSLFLRTSYLWVWGYIPYSPSVERGCVGWRFI